MCIELFLDKAMCQLVVLEYSYWNRFLTSIELMSIIIFFHKILIYEFYKWSELWKIILRLINWKPSTNSLNPRHVYQHQNKWYSQRCLLAHFEANLLAHNNWWLCYYVQVNSLRLKPNVVSKWTSKHLWEYHLFCCWWYITHIS